MDNSINKFYCPITRLIFSDPVVAQDGHIYEKNAILEWFENSSKSPLTGENINKKTYPIFSFKSELEEFLIKNPKYKSEQYVFMKKYKKSQFIKIIIEGDYEKLLEYNEFILRDTVNFKMVLYQFAKLKGLKSKKKNESSSEFSEISMSMSDSSLDTSEDYDTEDIINDDKYTNFMDLKYPMFMIKFFLVFCKDERIIKHVVDHSKDLFSQSDLYVRDKMPLFYIMRYCNNNILEYVFKKNVSPNIYDDLHSQPVHSFLKYNYDNDFIKYIINNDWDLLSENLIGITPLHEIFKIYDWNILKMFFERKYNLEYLDNYSNTPLHYLMMRDIVEIEHLDVIYQQIDFEIKNNLDWSILDIILLFQKCDIIIYTLDYMFNNSNHKKILENIRSKKCKIKISVNRTINNYELNPNRLKEKEIVIDLKTILYMNDEISKKDREKIVKNLKKKKLI